MKSDAEVVTERVEDGERLVEAAGPEPDEDERARV